MGNKLKIILLGDINVGKTRICHTFINDGSKYNEISTIGIEFKFKTIKFNNCTYKIHLWDTAGQERFRSLVRTYFKHNDSCVIVFDINNIDSFNNIKLWLDEINKYASNKTTFLIANKIDIVTENRIDDNLIDELINKNENIKGIYKISAKTGEALNPCLENIITKTIQNITDNRLYDIDIHSNNNGKYILLPHINLDNKRDETCFNNCCI